MSDDMLSCVHGRPRLGAQCPDCNRSWINVKWREAAEARNPTGTYTCATCDMADTCEAAWDDYNQDGDCLMEK